MPHAARLEPAALIRPGLLVFALASFAVLLAIACGRATSESTPTPTVAASPSPEPTASGPGRVRSTVQARCELSLSGAEVIVTYAAHALGAAKLTRVQILLNGETRKDSGSIERRDYRGVTTIPIAAGSRHSYRIVAETTNAARVSVGGSVSCPKAPSGPRA